MKTFLNHAHALGLSLTAVALMGCQASNPPLTGPQLPDGVKAEHAPTNSSKDAPVIKFDPRVDILFVIDDSQSMRNHQNNFRNNILKFVNQFATEGQASKLDFHIGFTFAFDSSRYGTTVPEVCGPNQTTPGRINWQPAGSLEPLKGLNENGRRFVTPKDDFRKILKESLDPGPEGSKDSPMVKYLVDPKDKNDKVTCPYGPAAEEMFTPLLGALTDPTREAGPNKGFRRPGAFFVTILLSDAKDASGIDEREVFRRVNAAVGPGSNGKLGFRIFAIAIKPGERIDNASCKPDPAWAPLTSTDGKPLNNRNARPDFDSINGTIVGENANPLANLARMTEDGSSGAQTLSICSKDYGNKLAEYGAQIQEDVYRDIVFPLPSQVATTGNTQGDLKVYLEGSSVPQGRMELVPGDQWVYNDADGTIIIYNLSAEHPNGVDWNKYPKAVIRPRWTPASKSSPDSKAI